MPGATLAADLWINEYLTPCDVWQHGVTKLLAARQTPFQEMQVVESGPYGKALILDGKWQTCTGDEFLYHEPIAHAPCVLHGRPERVLIAGGADGGVLESGMTTAWTPNRAMPGGPTRTVDLDIVGSSEKTLNPVFAAVNSRSYHPGGVNALLGDGSVRFVKDSINGAVWRSLGTVAGGEVVSSDSY